MTAFRLLLFFFLLFSFVVKEVSAQSQAQFFSVRVDASALPAHQKQAVSSLERESLNYLNREEQKIEVPIPMAVLTIYPRQVSSSRFTADITLEVRRPVYHSSAYTTLFKWYDKDVLFDYQPSRTLIAYGQEPTSQLEALLSFYKEMALGLWLSGFEEKGGVAHLQRAAAIAKYASSHSDWNGWEVQILSKNRFALATELSEQLLIPWYLYHRKGLDRFVDDPEQAKEEIKRSLEALEASTERGSWLWIWEDAKVDEIVRLAGKDPKVVASIKRLFPTKTLHL
ncbi:MAG: DUF4835 family protein [Porphyromonas sp.]|nr:DUF4835 family protein [Porphyromonas sp.]